MQILSLYSIPDTLPLQIQTGASKYPFWKETHTCMTWIHISLVHSCLLRTFKTRECNFAKHRETAMF